MKNTYTDEFRKIMQVNYDYTSMSANRIDEIFNFARGMNNNNPERAINEIKNKLK